MVKKLIIVESPTKAKTISKMLGSSYKVKASFGHLRDLPKSRLGIKLEDDVDVEYIKVRGKAKTINELKKDVKNSDVVYLATDPDREGEAISWHLNYLLELDENKKNRVVFNEITKEQVKKSLNNPRAIDMNLVNAQQARRVLDRIVGYEISPILWKRVKSGLSAGRVQSVVLKLICDRQEEIENFEKEEYWTVHALFRHNNIEFDAQLIKTEDNKNISISNEKECLKILDKFSNDFKVIDIKSTQKTQNPKPPFTTSTLQQEASTKLGFPTKKTMSIAQNLFEGISTDKWGSVGLITYMRTDSTRLSEEFIKECLDFIGKKYTNKYKSAGRKYSKQKKSSQDAHEAIRPTSIMRSPDQLKEYLTVDQYKLYYLIWTRTLQSQMAAYKYMQTTVLLQNNEYIFRTNGNRVVFDGFTIASTEKNKENILPDLDKDLNLHAEKIDRRQHFTKPPAMYTEASMVKALEEYAIGRPSTYSSTINQVLSRNYVRIIDKKLEPTQLGRTVNEFLQENFSNIINISFTARMESTLDKIADESLDWKKVILDFYGNFSKDIKNSQKDHSDYKVKDVVLEENCPKCGSKLAIKHGRNGKFIGCTNFPNCDFTKSIVKKTGVKCPKCGGDIIEKVSKKGKRFYGCSNFPDCDYAVWDKPIDKKCPQCNHPLLHKKNRKEDKIYCDHCGYILKNK